MGINRKPRYTAAIGIGLAAAMLAGCSSGAASSAASAQAAPTATPAATQQPTPEPTAVPELTTITLEELRTNCSLSALLEKYGAVNYVTTFSDAEGTPGMSTHVQYIQQGDQFWGTTYILDADGNLMSAIESTREGDDLGTFYYYSPAYTDEADAGEAEQETEIEFEIPEEWEEFMELEDAQDGAEDAGSDFLGFSVCPTDTFDFLVALLDTGLPNADKDGSDGDGEQELDCGPQDDALILSTKETTGDITIERYYYVSPATGELLARSVMAFEGDGSLIGSSLTQYSYATPRSDDVAASGMVRVGEGEGCAVTIITNPGTEKEQTYTYRLHQDAVLLTVDSSVYGLYSDAACTEEMSYTDLGSDDITIYLAKKGE